MSLNLYQKCKQTIWLDKLIGHGISTIDTIGQLVYPIILFVYIFDTNSKTLSYFIVSIVEIPWPISLSNHIVCLHFWYKFQDIVLFYSVYCRNTMAN